MVYAFGDCRLDIERRELWRGGALINLEPQVFDLLAYLVRHRERVVSRDALIAAIWNGRIVSDSALTTRINAVRRALGDDGAAQRLVRTFARKGVRFVADVTETPNGAASETREDLSGAASSQPALPLPERPSIAILPFQNMTGDPEQEYFVDGMVEEITTAIARLPRLFVIDRNSSFTYKGRAVDLKQVARELGVRYVLGGSVRKAGNRVRIAGQLIDTASGAHIWADRFDGTLGDIFDLQDRVASSVANAIEPRLHFAEIERARRKPTESLDAYDLYLRAMALVLQRTRESLDEAVRLARQALALDPAYAPAMGMIGGCRVLQRSRHWIPPSGAEVEEGLGMARQALAAARDDPYVLRCAGFTLAFLAGENDAALKAIDRAIALHPNYATAFGQRALLMVFLKRPEEAILAAQQALRLSPLSPAAFVFLQALAFAHLALGRYEEGLPWAEEALRENGGLPALRLKLSLCGHLGRCEEAREGLRQLREIFREPTVASVMRDVSSGLAPEIAARMAEGLRKAGVPDE